MRYLVFLAAVLLLAPVRVRAQDLSTIGSYSEDARAARISELKVKYRISLSEQERARVLERCDIAKSNLRKLTTKVVSSSELRGSVYDSVITKLKELRARVAVEEIDASGLELLIVDYQRAKTDFDVATTAYETALDDAVIVDCKQDPDGFRASIEGVREGRKNTSEVANEIDELTKSNLKTAFDTLKLRISVDGANSGN